MAECPNCGHEAAYADFSEKRECPECRTHIQRLHAIADERARSTGRAM